MPAGGGTSQTAVVRAAGGRTQKASLVNTAAALATMLLVAKLLRRCRPSIPTTSASTGS